MCIVRKLSDHLLSPLSSEDLALKENLIALLEGRAMVVTFRAFCVMCIDVHVLLLHKTFLPR
jgi:hypothetical protein